MKVHTEHVEYEGTSEFWSRARDTYAGEDAVKEAGEKYLAKLGAHKSTGGDHRYQMYVQRALFLNAVGRTVDGLAGAALRTDPIIDTPSNLKDVLKDITLRSETVENAAQKSTREILTTGRQGILVDVASDGRPYWTFWSAEDIVNWTETRIDSDPTLTMVVLREAAPKPTDDPFVTETEETFRVLTLAGGVYGVTRWTKDDQGNWTPGVTVAPKRRGKTLDFIPFTFINPTGTTATVEKPPLLDLINVNLSWYRNSADLEHGLHFVGVPQIVIMGAPQTGNDAMEFGSSVVWVLDQGADAKILQADGETLGALERALERKQKSMATLGARMLEDAASVAETATGVLSRSSGEHATLGTIVNTVEQAYAFALQISAWWALGDTSETPADVKVNVEFSKDFTATAIDPNMLRELVAALQADAISFETFHSELAKRKFGRGTTPKEELKKIEHGADGIFQKPEPPPMIPGVPPVDPNAPTPPPPPPVKKDDDAASE